MTLVESSNIPSPTRASIDVLDITVLAGGPGAEREVSLQSGQAVFEALKRLGHRVESCDIGPNDLSALDRPCDLVFIALHGEFGEDGTLQAELERRGIRFTGSGALASRLAMDKVEAKRRLEQAGLATPEYVVMTSSNLADGLANFALPAVVKPVASGSSVDTTIERTRGSLQEACVGVVERHGSALVERFIDGPELTVSILGDTALDVCEIRANGEFYDFDAKYVDDATEYLFALDLPVELIERVRQLSLTAHRALGCQVLSRVDWMIRGSDLEPFVLEVNTIPGFTSHSLVPKAAARRGQSFDDLCQQIVMLSLAKGTE